ncbi:uroporphyrinogen-III C-methyltransferase [Sulfurimonas sp.]|uniref:uroporphyrinogen-III C-methyltransferase n=1 Tax=Sulfurimonas sp. TaxID=2022749 RepID=UPI00356549C5
MKYTTLPIVLKNQKIILIGGGKVALQKAEVMQRNSVKFSCVSSEYIKEFENIKVSKTQKYFEIEDIESYSIVVDATGSKDVMNRLLAHKHKKNFLYNCVDVPEVCDFFFAALIEYGALKVAVSSAGASPTLAKSVRDKIKRVLPKELENLNTELKNERDSGIIDIKKAKQKANKMLGKVTLVGCGTGDVDLLTIKAYKTIQEADVVFIDHLISEEIKEIIPKDTMKINVGKEKGSHSVKQEKINEMLIDYASKGLTVARLKAGDPYIFGRGAEEAQALIKEQIRVDVIPGISSAIAGPLSAGIAPTARGYATNLSIVSAHLAGNRINTQWIDLLKIKNHTTIVLMGLSRADEIVEYALKEGIDENMPTAIISNASRPNQSRVITTLKDLPKAALDAPRPGIIVFGDVVNLHSVLPQYEIKMENENAKIA